jgi:hypothetical protein
MPSTAETIFIGVLWCPTRQDFFVAPTQCNEPVVTGVSNDEAVTTKHGGREETTVNSVGESIRPASSFFKTSEYRSIFKQRPEDETPKSHTASADPPMTSLRTAPALGH